MPTTTEIVTSLKNEATRLRILSVRATTAAGSGHPTSCLSAADIVATLFFSVMRFDPKNPKNPNNDRFVLSKGHAAPILYAAWAEAGAFKTDDLLQLRTIGGFAGGSVLCRRGSGRGNKRCDGDHRGLWKDFNYAGACCGYHAKL